VSILIEVDRKEVDQIVIELLRLLGRLDVRGAEAYVALMLVVSTVMLGLDELPSDKAINVVLARFFPLWDQLIAEQAGKSVH